MSSPAELRPEAVYEVLKDRQQNLSRVLQSGEPVLLRHAVYALKGSPLLALDSDVEHASGPEVNESKMSATFLISTARTDRMGDVVLPRGCEPHLGNYRANPTVLFAHRSGELPIGSAREPDSQSLLLDISDQGIRSTCYFHGETPESELVFRLVARKELRAASIGFLPIKAGVIERKKEVNRPETNDQGEDIIYFNDGSSWFPQLRFMEWDLTEWSIVPVPANPDCISMHLSRGHIEGEPLTPKFRSILEPWAAPRKVWSVGALFKELAPPPPPPPQEAPVTDPEPEPENKTFPAAVEKEETKESQPPAGAPIPEPPPDPKAGWPLGARFLADCLDQCRSWKAKIEADAALVEQKRVRNYSSRKAARLGRELDKLSRFSHKVYPDIFPAPPEEESSPEPAKALPPAQEPAPEPPQESLIKEIPAPAPAPSATNWNDLLAAVEQMSEKLSSRFFELTGKEL